MQTTGFKDDSFDQVSGARYREIFDLADWDRSVGINVPGQSGQPGSKHYDDLLPLWIEGPARVVKRLCQINATNCAHSLHQAARCRTRATHLSSTNKGSAILEAT